MDETTVPFETVLAGGAEVWCWKMRGTRASPLFTLLPLPAKCRITFYFVSDSPHATTFRFVLTCSEAHGASGEATMGTVATMGARLYEVTFPIESGEDYSLAICSLRRSDDLPDECCVIHGRVEK
jgi:hypothetical protein